MEVYVLFHFSHFHSVWDSKEKAVEFVRQYTMTFKKLKNAGPMHFYITKATMNNSKHDIVDHMIWSSWYNGREEINQLTEQNERLTGPTLRDQFAMAALTGLLANPNNTLGDKFQVKRAYDVADQMLVVRL